MNQVDDPAVLIRRWLRSQEASASYVHDLVATIAATPQRRHPRWLPRGGWPARVAPLAKAATAGVAVVAIVALAFPWLAAGPPPTASPSAAGPSPSASSAWSAAPATDSLAGCAVSSRALLPLPALALGPFAWGPGSSERDWPGSVRPERDRPGEDVHASTARGLNGLLTHRDAIGEAGVGSGAEVDITAITINPSSTRESRSNWIVIRTAADLLSAEEPTVRWVAYGLVIDLDDDGVGDYRIGMDNGPGPTGGHREWVTSLVTGVTDAHSGPPYGVHWDGRVRPDTYYPTDEDVSHPSVLLGMRCGPPGVRFYAWASVIEDARIVATDYAPDEGWLTWGRP